MPGSARHYRPEHHRERAADHRPSASQRGYDTVWRAIRLDYLRSNPLCVMCQEAGLLVAATVVDHVVSLVKGGTHDASNLQSLCAACHNVKGNKADNVGFQRGRSGQRPKRPVE